MSASTSSKSLRDWQTGNTAVYLKTEMCAPSQPAPAILLEIAVGRCILTFDAQAMRLRLKSSFAGPLTAIMFAFAAGFQTQAEPALEISAPRVFTNAAAFRELSLPQASDGLPVRLEGTVTFVDPARNLLVLQDASGALALNLESGLVNLRAGERIRVESSNAVPAIQTFPDFPGKPSGSDALPSFSAPTNWGIYYLSRMRALVVPPTTGDYSFFIASKGSSELRLSTNADPANLQKIAFVPTGKSTYPEQWNKYPSQSSTPVHLQGGQAYFISAIQEQHGGREDNLSVAWEGPGIERAVIDGKFLFQFPHRNTHGVRREYWNDYFAGAVEPLTSGELWKSALTVANPSVTPLGGGDFPKPLPFEVGEAIPPANNFSWIETEGVVEFASSDHDTASFELTAGKKRVDVQALDWAAADALRLEKMRVRLRGVCESVFDEKGNESGGIIRVSSPRDIVEITPNAAELEDLNVVPISDLTPANPSLAWGRQIRIRGTVVRQDTNGFFIQGPGTFSGFASVDGTHWRQIVPPVEIAMSDSALAGLAVSSFSDGTLEKATFDSVRGLTGVQHDVDITNTQPAGQAILAGSKYTVTGGGIGVASTLDQFHYVYEPLTGEGEIVARVTSLDKTSSRAIAGIMIRDSLDTKASFASLAMSAGGGAVFQFRLKRDERGATIPIHDCPLPCWLKLTRRHVGALVRADTNFVAQPGQEVDLAGTLEWQNGQPILLHVRTLDDATMQNAERGSSSVFVSSANEPPIVPISQLLPEEGESLRKGSGSVFVRGVVTFSDRPFDTNFLVIQDETAAASVRLNSRFSRKPPRVGDLVEFDLRSVNGQWAVPFEPSRIDVLGTARLPQPVIHPAEYSLARRGDWQWTEFEGIVRAATDNGTLMLMRKDGLMPVWIGNSTEEQLSRYVDALVRIRGVTIRTGENTRTLLVPSPEFIEVSEAAPQDPFVIPSIAIADLAGFSRRSAFHRVEISGVVTYRADGLLVAQDQTGGARLNVLEAPSDIQVGDLIEAVGFPDLENSSVALVETLVRKIATGKMPKPFEPPSDLQDSMQDALVVKLTGRVIEQQTVGEDQILELQSGRRAFRATLPKGFAPLPNIPAGSQVEVTGVSWAQPVGESAAGAGLTFDVLLRTPADVIVRQRPPWWTWKHTAATVGAFAIVLGLALFWIRLLHLQVAQRTNELQTAMTKLERETEISATLTERNRLAGELHDGLEQGLSAIMMQLDGLESKLSANPAEAVRYLKLARNMIRFSRTEVRHSLWDWKSPALTNKNLGTALSDIASRMSSGNQAKVTVQISGPAFPLPHATEHHLLRIGQEALTNALKYSEAPAIYLVLNYSETSVQLSVRDTGLGFVPEMVLNGAGGHFGLQNLRSRARKMGGRLTVTSAPGRGTTVEVTVPLNGAITRPQPNGHSTPNEN